MPQKLRLKQEKLKIPYKCIFLRCRFLCVQSSSLKRPAACPKLRKSSSVLSSLMAIKYSLKTRARMSTGSCSLGLTGQIQLNTIAGVAKPSAG